MNVRWIIRGWLPCLVLVIGWAARQEATRAADLTPIGLVGESRAHAARLAEADKLLAARQWTEAVALLQTILDSAGNDLVPVTPTRSVRVRVLCHLRLARLPVEVRDRYRERIEPAARKWLDKGLADNDREWLLRVVDEAFLSRAAEKALDRLGDLAFERGRFSEAEGWWRLLSPLEDDNGKAEEAGPLCQPDPPEALAVRARAKQLLARLFQGRAGWDADLARFQKRWGKAEGELTGRSGRYADILAEAARERQKNPPPEQPDWPTFAGNPSRSRVSSFAGVKSEDLPAHLARLCRAGPTWRFDLDPRARQEGGVGPRIAPKVREGSEKGKEETDVDRARTLAFYPVVAWPWAIVADARTITAHDLRTGKAEEWYDAGRLVGGMPSNCHLPAPPDLRYSLTVAEGCVFSRLGLQAVKDVRPPARRPGGPAGGREQLESVLVCLSLKPGPKGDRRRWLVRATDLGRKEYAVFEGSPVVAQGRVAIAATRMEGDRVITAIHCYASHPEDSEPPLLWKVDVCETREFLPARAEGGGGPDSQSPRRRHQLLTLAGEKLIYCSHSGAISALDLRSGQRLWSLRYARRDVREPEDDPKLRDLSPALFAEGRVFVAPNDSDRLLCLDPQTGEILWERGGLDAVHLLGVGQGQLIFTTRRNPGPGRLHAGGLRAVRMTDGSDETGWVLPDDGGGLTPMGRGLLLGDLVLWPTARTPFGVFAVRQRDGQQVDDPTLLHRIPAGNLAAARGCLLVADQRSLWAFVPAGLLLEEKEKAGRALPEGSSATTLVRAQIELGRALLDSGRAERAAHAFEQARRAIGKEEGYSARQQRRRAEAGWRASQTELCLTREVKEGTEEMDGLLAQALRDGSARERARTWLRWAGAAQERGDGMRALAAWQEILADPALRDLPLEDREGLPRRAGALARRAIVALRQQHGDGIFEKAEQKARGELEKGVAREPEGVLALSRRHAGTRTAREALAGLARECLRTGRPGAAARWWRRVVREEPAGTGWENLARCYEAQGQWSEAARVWQRAALADPAQSERIQRHLRDQPEFHRPVPSATPLPSSLRRSWETTLAEQEVLLDAGSNGSTNSVWTGVIVRSGWNGEEAGLLLARDPATGRKRWECPLPFAPTWAACHLDRVVVGGPAGVASVTGEDGVVEWYYPAPVRGRTLGEGFLPGAARAVGRVVLEAMPAGPLEAFRLEEGRIFCLQGRRRLLALDAETGDVLWQRRAPGSAFQDEDGESGFNPAYFVRGDRLLIQGGGRRWLLQAATGRLCGQGDAPEAWPWPPLALGKRSVGVVRDARTVERIDLETGRTLWTWTAPGRTTASGEQPLLVGDESRLLVVISENIGYRLQRLDPETGRARWREMPVLGLDRLDPQGWVVGEEVVFCGRRGGVEVRSLGDGAVLHSRNLPGETWRLLPARDGVLAWPAEANAVGVRCRWLWGEVQWGGGPLVDRPRPLVWLDRQAVEIHRESVQAVRGRVTSRLVRSRAFSFWPRLTEAWRGPSPSVGMMVQRQGPRLLTEWGGRLLAWQPAGPK
jgi:outer membrane protein assembly factor BamB/tetratricopeptide (TPR) repeat protein